MLDYILQIEYPSDRRDVDDQVEAILFLTTCSGSWIDDRDGKTLVSCYFKDTESRDNAHAMVHQIAGIEVTPVDREKSDWLDLYHQSLEPISIGDRFIVAPDPKLITDTNRLAIIIPQERAFGTGSHASTALCIETLETLSLDGAFGLDVGTGSGILAIAMERLGARKVIALDNDLETYGIVRRNLERNRIEPGCIAEFFGGPDAIRDAQFDVVTMNIIPEVILPLLPQVQRLVQLSGALIVSGILNERRSDVIDEAEKAGMTVVAQRVSGDWWCGRFGRANINY